jgi:hypothetical protein
MCKRKIRVHCGLESMRWYAFKRSLKRLPWLCQFAREHGGDVIPQDREAEKGMENLRLLVKGWKFGDSIARTMIWLDSWYDAHAGRLLELLLLGRRFNATDPRDKVYAVLGLANVPISIPADADKLPTASLLTSSAGKKPGSIVVDYWRSTPCVYQQLAKFVINQDRNLDILLLVQSPNAIDLPSWTPDWRSRDSKDDYLNTRYLSATEDLLR